MGLFTSFKRLFASKPKSNVPRIDLHKRFDLINRTGQGSMSKVWRARDKSLGRTICLKLLDKEKTAKFEARFPGANKPREGAICMTLRHKNIVQTFEHGLTRQGEPYLVMELIDGTTLADRLQGGPLRPREAAALLETLARALHAAHRRGIVHRKELRTEVARIIDYCEH